jgi:hypothetical protein
MFNKLKPVVTRWYEREDTGEIFEVIAVDAADGMVDVQNFEGEVAEMDMKTWQELNLSRVRSPQWYDRCAPYEVDRDITALNIIWDKWQQGSSAMH